MSARKDMSTNGRVPGGTDKQAARSASGAKNGATRGRVPGGTDKKRRGRVPGGTDQV